MLSGRMARSFQSKQARRRASIIDERSERREQILLVWQKLRSTNGDSGWLKIINGAREKKLDLDFPSAEGETILMQAVGRRYAKSVKRLLELEVDTNVQVSSMVRKRELFRVLSGF